jgi:hypothetical protein
MLARTTERITQALSRQVASRHNGSRPQDAPEVHNHMQNTGILIQLLTKYTEYASTSPEDRHEPLLV